MSAKVLLRKTSLVDYPGRISSVFFSPGCNLRCPWCHNRELVPGSVRGLVDVEEAFAHVRKRLSVLGGVVLSGGEPCLCEELPYIIGEIKKLGLPVKLDTNGMFPAMLENLFSYEGTKPDYIALDLKMSPDRYAELLPYHSANVCNPGAELIRSAALIRHSGIDHEFRTLVLPPAPGPGGFIGEEDIEALAPLAGAVTPGTHGAVLPGAQNAPWYFRPFRGGNCLDPAWDSLEEPAAKAQGRAEALTEKVRKMGINVLISGFS